MDFQDAARIVSTTEEEKRADENQVFVKKARHPIVGTLHILLKVIPFLCYIFMYLFLDGYFIISFSICLLITAVDFWITKNINGRLLVGLRYWNKIGEDGKSQWIFEALEEHQKVRISTTEMWIFWITLIITPVVWALSLFICFVTIKLNYLCLCVVCFVMEGSNLIGFIMCAKGSRAKLKKKAKKAAADQTKKAAMAYAEEQFK